MDLFEEYLNKKEESSWVKRALTDNSYKKYYNELNGKEYPEKTNKDLATLGDAVIKLCYCDLLFDKENDLTIKKSQIESDKYFVTNVAQHYDLLKDIKTDSKDPQIKRDYNYDKLLKTSGGNKKRNPHKYIATAVEAMIGAIYKETNDLEKIKELLETWEKMPNEVKND